MTIEQKAREIAVKANLIWADAIAGPHPPTIAARLGIIEGLEMAAKVADEWCDENRQSATDARKQDNRQFASELDGAAIECNAIAVAIRSLK